MDTEEGVTGMGKQALVFRKFLSDDTDHFVSVYGGGTDYFHSVELCLYSGADPSFFNYYISRAADIDEQYQSAILELEALKAAVNAAMDELIDAYTDIKFGALNEEAEKGKYWPDEKSEEDDPWEPVL